ncbi:DUF4065 domain-containing protein [Candidatus Gracilibacteria bacterium]|nr:DUF4065 domain-containing protein [Candidatus Gracilibacteria bacterium]
MKTIDTIDLANYIYSYGKESGLDLNLTQIQKLMYIIYGWNLCRENEIDITEQPQAWPYGPVFPRTMKKGRIKFGDQKDINTDTSLTEIRKNEIFKTQVEDIVKKYGKISAGKLSEWSHLEGSPWYKSKLNKNFQWGDQIDDFLIKEYFRDFSF